jgi:hypothetical protein
MRATLSRAYLDAVGVVLALSLRGLIESGIDCLYMRLTVVVGLWLVSSVRGLWFFGL